MIIEYSMRPLVVSHKGLQCHKNRRRVSYVDIIWFQLRTSLLHYKTKEFGMSASKSVNISDPPTIAS